MDGCYENRELAMKDEKHIPHVVLLCYRMHPLR